jgi:hypothetical protein
VLVLAFGNELNGYLYKWPAAGEILGGGGTGRCEAALPSPVAFAELRTYLLVGLYSTADFVRVTLCALKDPFRFRV